MKYMVLFISMLISAVASLSIINKRNPSFQLPHRESLPVQRRHVILNGLISTITSTVLVGFHFLDDAEAAVSKDM